MQAALVTGKGYVGGARGHQTDTAPWASAHGLADASVRKASCKDSPKAGRPVARTGQLLRRIP